MDRTTDAWVVEAMNDHLPALQRYVRSLVRDADEADDIAQEACIRLLLAARAGNAPDAPAAWMNRVAHNLVISGARHKAVAQRTAPRLVERNTAPGVDAEVIQREQQVQVNATLAAARSDDRRAIVLSARGHRTADIAAQLGRTELATRALLCRARARLRQDLIAADAI
ncbi:MAG TPA: sigma-70 family RNA polymerase sigma factor [Candidatus Limnocylindrales bacterium]|jgi:RNA polymerase sigma-70 factor (ECF subfamily)